MTEEVPRHEIGFSHNSIAYSRLQASYEKWLSKLQSPNYELKAQALVKL
jgi:hypothetical protein